MNHNEKMIGDDLPGAALGQAGQIFEPVKAGGFYTVECRDADGSLIWTDTIENIITTAGKNDMLEHELAGSGYTAAWYMGLISNVSYTSVPVVADTMASHATWTESQNYSQGSRPTTAWNAAAGGSKALSAALVFTINATDTIKGCFLCSIATKGGTTGTLFSAGLFTGGDQPVVATNTLNVSYTATLT